MVLNRRSFLGTLMAGIAGTVFVRSPSALLWQPAKLTGLPPVTTGAILTLNQMTLEILRKMHAMGAKATLDPTLTGLGNGAEHQIAVDMVSYPEEVGPTGLDRRNIDPIAAKLVEMFNQREIRTVGRLDIPMAIEHACVVSSHESGLCVRGLHDYDVLRDEHIMRFDLLGGAAA